MLFNTLQNRFFSDGTTGRKNPKYGGTAEFHCNVLFFSNLQTLLSIGGTTGGTTDGTADGTTEFPRNALKTNSLQNRFSTGGTTDGTTDGTTERENA